MAENQYIPVIKFYFTKLGAMRIKIGLIIPGAA